MATTSFGVLPSEVLEGLPFAEGTVTETSKGLNFSLINGYINEGSVRLAAAMVSAGMAPDELSDDALSMAQTGVLAYARAQCLIKREFSEADVKPYLDQWHEYRDLVTSFVGGFGVSDATSQQIISTSKATPDRRFKERWNGF